MRKKAVMMKVAMRKKVMKMVNEFSLILKNNQYDYKYSIHSNTKM
jgi:hypothetical protein